MTLPATLDPDLRRRLDSFAIEFANPWHDEIGRFAPKGHGRRVDGKIKGEEEIEADEAFAEKYGNERPSGEGNCFDTALHYVMDVPADERDRYRVVHGVPTGQGQIEGLRFDHAWVERTDELPDEMPEEQRRLFEQYGMNVTVIDKSNGNDVEMPRSLYYSIGNIDQRDVTRYTFDEAAREAIRTKHYGPWK